jgi:hypothetical protein
VRYKKCKRGDNMFILVKDKFTLEEMGDSFLLLRLNDDGKTFSIIKNRADGAKGDHHNSMLSNCILTTFKLFKRKIENEETN